MGVEPQEGGGTARVEKRGKPSAEDVAGLMVALGEELADRIRSKEISPLEVAKMLAQVANSMRVACHEVKVAIPRLAVAAIVEAVDSCLGNQGVCFIEFPDRARPAPIGKRAKPQNGV